MTEREKLSFYPHSCEELRRIILEKFPGLEAKEGLDDVPAHCLWMIEKISQMKDSPRAGRWLGYIFGRLEALDLLNNNQSRDMARADAQAGRE